MCPLAVYKISANQCHIVDGITAVSYDFCSLLDDATGELHHLFLDIPFDTSLLDSGFVSTAA